ncbi:hypothetical protein ACTOB_003802 [Actinoplanes oblitus]|uniref:Uncharacterized protein n=1 Tax=Actinoplanes oblitus TaxID=3040509 RepID=A0ABY8WRM9_9ACTN|nr:hypothetical protein [Actinoplanes oblitus]WIN00118.1 hypothetical protein ACTOB_003802 [Actinoplanes oblitus]
MIALRPEAPRWSLPALAGTTLAGVLLATITGHSAWAVPVAMPLITTATVKYLWSVAKDRRDGRLARLVWRGLGKVALTRPDGRAMLSIAQVRAEYGQSVLDDAARDPELDRILDSYVDELAAQLRKPTPKQPTPVPLTVVLVTAFANGYLEAVTDPRRRPGASPYRGYSLDMVVLAALCRLADRLDDSDLPEARPATR